MPTGRNPDHMTDEERRAEIARILADGMLRAVRHARRSESANSNDSAESGGNRRPKGTHLGAELGPTWGSHDT